MNKLLKPNHLANLIDHQASAVSILPSGILKKCLHLNKLTNELKTLLTDCLPEEALQTLIVCKYANGELTISVKSHTVANHLRYQSNNLINILKEQSVTFDQLASIDVIVTHSANLNPDDKTSSKLNTNADMSGGSHNFRGLTETTKGTISYTVEHVITNQHLKTALEKLIKS